MTEQVQTDWFSSNGYKNIAHVRRIQSYVLESVLLEQTATGTCSRKLCVMVGSL